MSGVVAWFSKATGEICLSLQPDFARRVERAVSVAEGIGRGTDPALLQLRDEVRAALREAPAGV